MKSSLNPIFNSIAWCCYKWTYLESALLWLLDPVEDISTYYNYHPYTIGCICDCHDSNLRFSLSISYGSYEWGIITIRECYSILCKPGWSCQ